MTLSIGRDLGHHPLNNGRSDRATVNMVKVVLPCKFERALTGSGSRRRVDRHLQLHCEKDDFLAECLENDTASRLPVIPG